MSSWNPNPAWDIQSYVTHQMSILELETVLSGIITTALIILTYAKLRSGVHLLSTGVNRRLAYLILGACIISYTLFTIHLGLSIQAYHDFIYGLGLGNPVVDSVGHPTSYVATVLWTLSGSVLLESAMFGAFCTLIVLTVYVFAQRGLHARLQQAMLAVALLMFAISLAHWIFQTWDASITFGIPIANDDGKFQGVHPVSSTLPMALVSTNVILSDAIVLWRMCVLYEQHPRARALAIVLLSLTLTFAVVNVAKHNTILSGESSDSIERLLTDSFGISVYGFSILVVSLVTNLIATALISWRTWHYRRDIAVHLGSFSRPSIVGKLMVLLVECGCIYCVVWIVFLPPCKRAVDESLGLITSPNPSDHVNGAIAWLSLFMAQVTGIYPTIILLVVALEQSYLEDRSPGLSTFRCAHPPPTLPAQTRGHTTPVVSFSFHTQPHASGMRGETAIVETDGGIEAVEMGWAHRVSQDVDLSDLSKRYASDTLLPRPHEAHLVPTPIVLPIVPMTD